MSKSMLARPAALALCAMLALSAFASCNKAADDKAAPPAASLSAPPASVPLTADAPATPATPATPGTMPVMALAGSPAGLTATNFKVEGMTCVDCCAAITQSLSKIDGVKAVSADWQAGAVNVSYEPGKVQPEQLSTAIETLKYKVVSADAAGAQACPAGKSCPTGAACPAGKDKDGCKGCKDGCCPTKPAAGKDAKAQAGGSAPKPAAKGSHA